MKTVPQAKDALRAALITARRVSSESERALARAAVGAHLLDLLGRRPGTVCGYLPLPSEPLDRQLLMDLSTRGVRVLVPVTSPGAALDWVIFDPNTPADSVYLPDGDRLGSESVRQAHTVLVPALAVDPRGYRLGRGGGHYDRTLALALPSTVTIALVRDSELVEKVPTDSFDIPVRAVITPGGGYREITGSW